MPDTTNDAPLSLERFAEVSAYLVHFKAIDEAEILGRLAVRPEALAAARKTWTDRLGNDVPRGQVTHALTLAKAYAKTKARLEAERPDVASSAASRQATCRASHPARRLRRLGRIASERRTMMAWKEAGLEPVTTIACPLTTQQVSKYSVEWGRLNRRLLGINRALLVFRKANPV